MSDIAIQAEGLSKLYRLGRRERYRTLRDTLTHLFRSPLRVASNFARAGAPTATDNDVIWALQDVSFEVAQGEVLGVIGHNGAGKSTLLKLLARITPPTRGTATIRGRVGSLLEVATGFHPELSGRENVFLNGAILGMRKAEIDRKFDEIVAFAEVEQFLDTPVKHYSSGMYVRLAFAVAAHLEPEILLVDEVLAVGDMKFQRKCLAKTSDVAREGRTVLVVSHQMQAIAALANRAICLERGAIVDNGPPNKVIAGYLKRSESGGGEITDADRAPDARFPVGELRQDCLRFTNVYCSNPRGEATRILYYHEPMTLHISFEVLRPLEALRIGGGISTPDGVRISNSHHTDGGLPPLALAPGNYSISVTIENFLAPGDYLFTLGAHDLKLSEGLDFIPRSLSLSVVPFSEDGSRLHDEWSTGCVTFPTCWTEPKAAPAEVSEKIGQSDHPQERPDGHN